VPKPIKGVSVTSIWEALLRVSQVVQDIESWKDNVEDVIDARISELMGSNSIIQVLIQSII
jgi:hypothetical protein